MIAESVSVRLSISREDSGIHENPLKMTVKDQGEGLAMARDALSGTETESLSAKTGSEIFPVTGMKAVPADSGMKNLQPRNFK